MKKHYIAQAKHLISVSQHGWKSFSQPQILGVYSTLEEAKEALSLIGADYGDVLEVRNPIQTENCSYCFDSPRIHEWQFKAA